MTSFICLTFAVLLFLSWAAIAQDNSTPSVQGDKSGTNLNMTYLNLTDNSTSSPEDKTDTNLNLTTLNLTNASTTCKLGINESAVENILRFMHKYTTHVVEIEVCIDSRNKTRIFPELKWPWASEIGRTLISLIVSQSSSSSLHFITLNPGIEKVNVVVFEEKYGCLPTGSKGAELVFDFLLKKLSYSDDTHDYELCRVHSNENDVNQYNCCGVATDGKLTICADYSSIVLEYTQHYIGVMTALIICAGLPLIIQYLRSFPNERECYKITDSPMALSTIFHTLFIDGHGLIKSAFRRFVFWSTVIVMFSLTGPPLIWNIVVVFLIYPLVCVEIFLINEEAADRQLPTDVYNAYITSFTLPFNAKFWWSIFMSNFSELQTLKAKIRFAILSVLLFPVAFTFVFGFNLFSLVYVVCYKTLLFSLSLPFRCFNIFATVLQFIALVLLIHTIPAFLNLTLLLITGVYLNGTFYGPIVMPVIALVVYSLQHWRSFVETKYLVLMTNNYEVCRELWENTPRRNQNRHHLANHLQFTVNVNDGKVPKTLYTMIRERILPYDKVLLQFFARMFFVANFFFIVSVVMSLAQKSNISGPVQIISTMIVSTLPFIFDGIWAETFEQKQANSKEQKRMIREIMTIQEKYNNEIMVSIAEPVEENITNITWSNFLLLANPIWKVYWEERNREESVSESSSED